MSQINLSGTGGAPTRSTRSAARAAAPTITEVVFLLNFFDELR
jgi:hypothetical protein